MKETKPAAAKRIAADGHERIRLFPGFVVAQGQAADGTEIEPPKTGEQPARVEDCVWLAAPKFLHAPRDVSNTNDNWTDRPCEICELAPAGERLFRARVQCKARLSNQGMSTPGDACLSYIIMAPRA